MIEANGKPGTHAQERDRAQRIKERILREAREFLAELPGNRSEELGSPWFDEPLVRFADARDPYFQDCKRFVGPDHLTPEEAWEGVHGEGSFHGGTVISIALPIAPAARRTNARQRDWPSREMIGFRNAQGPVLEALLRHLTGLIEEEGGAAFAPGRSSAFRTAPGPDGGPASNWSERHVAFAAGTGTFSLNDAFITEKGIAVRMTSLLTDLVLPPSRRAAQNYGANCMALSRGVCGACIKRCPAGALSRTGHDKVKCAEHLRRQEGRDYAASQGGDPALGAGCALCQSGVPCEERNPTRRRGDFVLDEV
jgi:epoxyqueuosine reductase